MAWGASEWSLKSLSDAYEKIILGLIMFIPGSYHTVLAIQALRGIEGWDFKDLTVFESDKWHDDND